MNRHGVFVIGLFLAGFAIAAEACGSDDAASPSNGGDGGSSDASLGDGAANDGSSSGDGGACAHNAATADDRVRNVLISHPFAASGDPATLFEVLSLAT